MPPEPNGTSSLDPQTPATVPAAPEKPATIVMPPTSTQVTRADANVDWPRKWDNLRGELKARQSEWAEWQGQATRQLQQAQEGSASLKEQLAALQAEKTAFEEQIGQIPDLQGKAAEALTLRATNEKLGFVLKFPKLIAQGKVVEEEVEGEKIKKRVNPFLDLVLSSSLEGEAFEKMVAELAGAMGTTPPATVATTQGAIPPGNPQPTVAVTADDLARQRNEARDSGDYSLASELNLQLLELQSKTS